ncbi:hypothetical protein CcI156_11915 [Frankia sp. CcI156]|uniref:Uncharacterized protein n=1 Tax=Frankia casuarinae (strain DSM 45818 / CECT 9043 / HFP020203 / CcI3) TaxID=106370 RepID=Q2JGZ4_FRACC|nr:hypothetical protein Francci3_0054 [Frankia casuarinae]ETA02776.1 hypothetical protein CcI6DRAFT_01736 [Frankia sp. CcI6]KDA44341.1 hypothetical protein BMG523Draft_00840 [Frankia sp. BMG5.23]KEZ35033.1 hypothetical protein CEDDRAFT_03583 [Frankia sp. CeD]KFB06785.1 hypothetical protein ALLO2DRAFT_00071 [Frankia sp. Allo2]OHV52271.1 hypothetical protein CgIS1_02805 [Frankia sp. CgIS1]ONH25889.1 hypothetical protein CcI156_11915 [Frankia sp. CcI156]ORT53415.1 hypothetical protein KBI5_0707
MGIPLSLLLLALGAILAFAVRSEPSGLDITAVGIILMCVSAIGLGLTLYRDQWRRKIVEESVENGVPAPRPLDDGIIVDPSAPFEAPHRRELGLTPEEDRRLNPSRHPEATYGDGQPAIHVHVEGDHPLSPH